VNGSEAQELDPRAVRLAFDRAARSYDAAAVLQREIAARMMARLDYVKFTPATVLDAGCGTGYALAGLRERYPQARQIALDLAPGMLQELRRRENWLGRLTQRLRGTTPLAVCGDIAALPLAARSASLAWSNLTLQWCNDPAAAFRELHRVLEVDGLLMFSTFGPDTLKELRAAFASVDGLTHTNRFVDMHDLGDMLLEAGFANPVMDREDIILTYDDARSMMRDLKAIGAHNATLGRPRGLMGRGRWAALNAALERFRREGRLPATYEIVYGHAWKPQPKTLSDGRAIMHFERRRAAQT
jgi:malonyl-CoA O-methyltransferase